MEKNLGDNTWNFPEPRTFNLKPLFNSKPLSFLENLSQAVANDGEIVRVHSGTVVEK
ncbi:hypothetical protein QOT17_002102 [Balamuthia mandrillaris]